MKSYLRIICLKKAKKQVLKKLNLFANCCKATQKTRSVKTYWKFDDCYLVEAEMFFQRYSFEKTKFMIELFWADKNEVHYIEDYCSFNFEIYSHVQDENEVFLTLYIRKDLLDDS